MKNLLIYIFLVVVLVACGSGPSIQGGCSNQGDVCISMLVGEPFQFGKANTITITVTSTKNVSGLGIYLYATPLILIEDMDEWVNNGVNWVIDIAASQPQTFTKNILLPESEGFYTIICSANTSQLRAVYSLVIHQQQTGSTIYYSGTTIPITPGPLPTMSPNLLQTLRALPTSTPLRTLAPEPTKTTTPTSVPYPAAPTPPGEGPFEEPYP